MFSYVVSRSVDEVQSRRKSQYYPVTFEHVLREIRGDGKRYAFVGIPCAVTAVRHLAAADPMLREQLAFVVGIVCGHLKSMAYAQSFAWQLGVAPPDLAAVDFRIKDPERTSREYGFQATATDGRTAEAKTMSLVGGSWGHAVFQLGACDFCDDIFAETADVVLGDAWLAKYEIDWRGTNMVVTRDQTIDQILLDGRASGAVTLDDLSVASIVSTQAGNFRHRRDGLAVRLHDDDEAGQWHPRKRVVADLTVVDAKQTGAHPQTSTDLEGQSRAVCPGSSRVRSRHLSGRHAAAPAVLSVGDEDDVRRATTQQAETRDMAAGGQDAPTGRP